jgi:hypothetical protein
MEARASSLGLASPAIASTAYVAIQEVSDLAHGALCKPYMKHIFYVGTHFPIIMNVILSVASQAQMVLDPRLYTIISLHYVVVQQHICCCSATHYGGTPLTS